MGGGWVLKMKLKLLKLSTKLKLKLKLKFGKTDRRNKRKAILEKAKMPMPPLPIRELSEYEKIREEFIAQRKKEWEIYEKEWEKQWEAREQSKNVK